MIVDGRALARKVLGEVRAITDTLPERPRLLALTIDPTPATWSYLSIKGKQAHEAGIDMQVLELPSSVTTEEVMQTLSSAVADAVIVQLPLPEHLDRPRILNAIPRAQDADVLSENAYHEFEQGKQEALIPPVAGAVAEILKEAGVDLNDKRILIIGNGRLVGQPVFHWLAAQGLACDVVTRESEGMLGELLPQADVVISGAGSPGLIKPEALKQGAVLIDAGTSESGGAIVGDADSRCAEVASVFTPVPGGVGPVAVACLFRNAAILTLRRGGEGV